MAIDKSATIGIDLGTTYCCMAIYCHNRVQVIPNNHGNHRTPSYVALDEDLPEEWLIGEDAMNQSGVNLKGTVFNAKRIIGRKFNDPELQQDMKSWPFQVVDSSGMAKIKLEGHNGPRLLLPEDISAKLLKYMKDIAENFLGVNVKDAVITVPANFNDAQRAATLAAGKKAGLNVLSLLNEPTAAALAYGQHLKGEQNILLFDFGGRTLDVSILHVKNGNNFEVKATCGDMHLGGEDLDLRLAEYVAAEFKRNHGVNLLVHPRAFHRLRKSCEEAKRTLSRSKTAKIGLEFIHGQLSLEATVSREKFEDLCADLLKLVTAPVKRVLELASLGTHQINEVILTGGNSRIPKVQTYLTNFFGGKSLQKSIDPDEAFAIGAALQAVILSGEEKAMTVVESSSLSFGTGSGWIDSPLVEILPRGKRIPATASLGFTTLSDHQSCAKFDIYEGSSGVGRAAVVPHAAQSMQQRNYNFSHIDATLFGMFAFSNVFDDLLRGERKAGDPRGFEKCQWYLREKIIGPLRNQMHVPTENVDQLCKLVYQFSNAMEMNSPEEFIVSLFQNILGMKPLLKLTSGDVNWYTLPVKKNRNVSFPTIQKLFDESLVSDVHLMEAPDCMILQVSRSETEMNRVILPSFVLDIASAIIDHTGICCICGDRAQVECKGCTGWIAVEKSASTKFCHTCSAKRHRKHELHRPIEIPTSKSDTRKDCALMKLFAVICAKAGCYVSFATDPTGLWYFLDSMADQGGTRPKVQCFGRYYQSVQPKTILQQLAKTESMPEPDRHFFEDGYLYFYRQMSAPQSVRNEGFNVEWDNTDVASIDQIVTATKNMGFSTAQILEALEEYEIRGSSIPLTGSALVNLVLELSASGKSGVNESDYDSVCIICIENPADHVFVPCGHLKTCKKCSNMVKECPVCRKMIKDRIRVFQ